MYDHVCASLYHANVRYRSFVFKKTCSSGYEDIVKIECVHLIKKLWIHDWSITENYTRVTHVSQICSTRKYDRTYVRRRHFNSYYMY